MTTSMIQPHVTAAYTLRPATLDDLPEAVAMFNVCSRESSGKDEFDLEDYRNEWSDPGIDLAADTRVAQTPDGTIVGCIEVWNTPPYTVCWIWGRVHPAFRSQGIGTALMDWAEGRAHIALERAPANARVVLEAGTVSTHLPTIELLQDRGYIVVRHALTMERELDDQLPEPIWPAGIAVRTMR